MGLHQAPLLIASLLLCIGSASGVGAQYDCPPSTCGNLQISSPFRLKGDKPTCGDRRYELTCDGNKTIADINSAKYYVESIFNFKGKESAYPYRTGALRIIDVGLAGGGCALPSNTVFRDFHTRPYWLKWTESFVSFVNCTKEIEGSNFSMVTYVPLPCLSGSNAFVYAIYTSRVEGLAPSCKFLAMVPIYGEGDTEAGVFDLLQRGINLSWYYSPGCSSVPFVFKDCYARTWKLVSEPENIWGTLSLPNFYNGITDLFLSLASFIDCVGSCQFYSSNPLSEGSVTLTLVLAILVLARILVRFVLPIFAVFALVVYKYREMRGPADAVEKFLINQQSLTPTRYAYIDIIVMTRNFRDKIGQGGFGSVYKGKLPGGFQVAIKILGNSKCNGDDFISEVSTIGMIHHINIVRLVGFCSEGSKRALVYEYLPKGSLDKYIFSSEPANQRPFTLDKLIDIALGVARGIDYLHQGCDMRILHFDIKPQNILLDNCFGPKVSDFGLAKLFPKDYSMVALSAARGTIGYIAPEQVSRSFGIISYKSDVYSFGMLLMEMAGGRRNVEPKAENTSQIYYPSWIYEQLNDERDMHGIVRDVATIGEIERKLSIVGLWCIQTRPSQRPSMSRVIEMLQAEVSTLQMPPKPFLSAERVPSMSIRDHSTEASFSTLTVISEHESHI